MISLLKPGMDPEEVRNILGSPTLINSIDNYSQWLYIYYAYKKNAGIFDKQQLTLWFKEGYLVRWSSDRE